MPPVDPEEFGDQALAPVFIAATLREAREAEAVLTEHHVRYTVESEVLSRTLFGLPRHSAVFYVVVGDAETSAAFLIAAGLELGVVKK